MTCVKISEAHCYLSKWNCLLTTLQHKINEAKLCENCVKGSLCELHHNDLSSIQTEITSIESLYGSDEFQKSLRRSILLRRKKRRRLKRRQQKIWENTKKRRDLLSRIIDVNMKANLDLFRADKEIRDIAQQNIDKRLLVQRRITDVRKWIKQTRMLKKLRRARRKSGYNSSLGCEDESQLSYTFETETSHLLSLLNNQLILYRSQLRFLEEGSSALPSSLHDIDNLLFRSNSCACDTLQNSAIHKHLSRADTSTEALLDIRRQWDYFVHFCDEQCSSETPPIAHTESSHMPSKFWLVAPCDLSEDSPWLDFVSS